MEISDNLGSCRSEFWGICCESGKKYSQVVGKKFHISMAALDPTVVPTSPCVSLMVERGGCQYLLCSLKPDSLLQVNLNLFFDKGEKITFSLKGHGTIHLSGYHILNENELSTPESFKTAKVAPAKKSSAPPSITPLKKGNQTSKAQPKVDLEEESSDDDDDSEDAQVKPAPVKKSSAAPSNTPVFQSYKANQASKAKPKVDLDLEEESSDDDDSEDDQEAKMIEIYSKKRLHTSNESQSEEDSSEEDDSSDESEEEKKEAPKKAMKDFQSKKRLKTDSSTPLQKGKPNQKTPNKFAGVIDLEDDSKTNSQLNSSIGRTPMPKKSAFQQKTPLNESQGPKQNPTKKTQSKDESSDSETDELNSSAAAALSPKKPVSPGTPSATPNQTASAKKKKKKKSKAKANDSSINEGTPAKANESSSKPMSAKKLPGGLQVEDIRVGNGPIAKKGKMVHVFYTGKLDNNKVFDSCMPGRKPFSFQLGTGSVIKGWDQGLEGMKVGGKRRLTVPPQLGYSHKRVADIPPNSTLHFDVELKAVS